MSGFDARQMTAVSRGSKRPWGACFSPAGEQAQATGTPWVALAPGKSHLLSQRPIEYLQISMFLPNYVRALPYYATLRKDGRGDSRLLPSQAASAEISG